MTLEIAVTCFLVVIGVVGLGALWISGVRLLVGDLRGKRVGETPFCTKCGYNLTALSSEICPECGVALMADNVRRGELRRDWLAVAGTVFRLLILLAVSLLLLALAMPSTGSP
jgi:predicted RNA-binding Zn-ribbon protein involved in translation (DUF1610 family)